MYVLVVLLNNKRHYYYYKRNLSFRGLIKTMAFNFLPIGYTLCNMRYYWLQLLMKLTPVCKAVQFHCSRFEFNSYILVCQ